MKEKSLKIEEPTSITKKNEGRQSSNSSGQKQKPSRQSAVLYDLVDDEDDYDHQEIQKSSE